MAVPLPRHPFSSFAFTTCLVVLALSTFRCSARAADTIHVELNSGRRLSGWIGSTSDESSLHLRIGDSALWIVQPVPSNRIQSATRNGETVTIDQLRQLAVRFQGVSEHELVPLPPPAQPDLQQTPQLIEPPTSQPARGVAIQLAPLKVSAVNVDAVIANWDADVEPDGIIVNVRPLDQQGIIIPTSGSLQLMLAGTRRGRRSFHASEMSRADDVSVIGRWTRRLRIQDVGPKSAFIKLPFGATDPDFDPAVGDFGLIHVRLAIAGVGVFEDARDNVLIRTPGFTRDALERGTGRRFLPFERTGKGTRRGILTYPSIGP